MREFPVEAPRFSSINMTIERNLNGDLIAVTCQICVNDDYILLNLTANEGLNSASEAYRLEVITHTHPNHTGFNGMIMLIFDAFDRFTG